MAKRRGAKPTKKRHKKRVTNKPCTYGDRDRLLKKMGYPDYLSYLHSPLWRTIKSRAFQCLGNSCFLCGGRATVIHHISYDKKVLLGKSLTELAPLCDPCHEYIEVCDDGSKRPLAKVQSMYRRMRRVVLGNSPDNGK